MKLLSEVVKPTIILLAKTAILLAVIFIAMSLWGHSRVKSGVIYLEGAGYTSVVFNDITYDWTCEDRQAAYLYDVTGLDGVPKEVGLCMPISGKITRAQAKEN